MAELQVAQCHAIVTRLSKSNLRVLQGNIAFSFFFQASIDQKNMNMDSFSAVSRILIHSKIWLFGFAPDVNMQIGLDFTESLFDRYFTSTRQ